MKVTIDTKEFKKVLIAYVASANNAELQALKSLKLEAFNGTFSCTGYDLTVGVTTRTENVSIKEEGVAVVPSSILKNIGNLTYGTIELKSSGSTLKLSTETDVFNATTFPEDDFPCLPNPTSDNPTEISCDVGDFKFAIDHISFACDLNLERKNAGVHFVVENNELTLLGIDGHKMAVRKIPCHSSVSKIGLRLDLTCLERALKAFPKEGTMKVEIYDRHVHIEFSDSDENASIYLRIINGYIDNYEQFIPPKKTIVTVNREVLLLAVRKCSIFNEDHRLIYPIKTDIRAEQGIVKLSLTSQTGKCDATVPANINGDEDVVIGLDPNFLFAGVNNCINNDENDDDEITLTFNGPLSPVCISKKDSKDLINLIVPMRLSK